MFCVECGREGPTLEGLCASCFAKRRRLVHPPETIDVVVCAHCSRLQLDAGWALVDLDDAIPRLLQERISVDPRATGTSFTQTARKEDARNYRLSVKFAARLGEFDIAQSFRIRLRVKQSVCPTCSRQHGRYYEAIVQVRAQGRDLQAHEMDRVARIVGARFSRQEDREAFVSRVEQTEGGVDFYVSTGTAGKAAARKIAEALDGEVRASPKIHGRKEGRDVYRVTYHVRLPGYRRGDLVRFQGRMYRVRAGGADIEAIDLEDWTTRRIRRRDLQRAEPIQGMVDRYRVVEVTPSKIVLARNGTRMSVRRPEGWARAEEVLGIAIDDTVRLLPEV